MGKTYKEVMEGIERYQIRDKETKEIRISFRTFYAVLNHYQRMNFGLNRFYEIFDAQKQEVIHDPKEPLYEL
jgi:hypothetical protein